MTNLKTILVLDDEINMRHMLDIMLTQWGYQVNTASNGFEGLKKIKSQHFDIILCDLKMPKLDGIGFLSQAKDRTKDTAIIMMSAYGTIETAVSAMKMGAYDYISKPFKTDEILIVLNKAYERNNLKQENLLLKKQIATFENQHQFGKMIAKNKKMLSVFKLAEKAADYDTTVLIMGDSGTGKEMIAKGIHFTGKRKKNPFIPVNCGSIPETLLNSELFGHLKGAFTGADKYKKGLFEEAEKGTLFLDEIGEMPLSLQVKLLRVLQENEIRPVGSSKTKKIDVRIIAATSKNLSAEVENKTFRRDLFYRLNVLPVKLPPLYKRTEDIPMLVDKFIEKYNLKFEKDIKGINSSAMSHLLIYKWPGNVRQLENTIERGILLCETKLITEDNISDEIKKDESNSTFDNFLTGYSLKKAQKKLEKKMITKALCKTKYNRTKAAALLEISHPSLLNKIKIYSIKILE